ncbi:MAG: hypothetical protein AAGF24_01285 [Cyanobacteria bacterium P01_H01_bin.121]
MSGLQILQRCYVSLSPLVKEGDGTAFIVVVQRMLLTKEVGTWQNWLPSLRSCNVYLAFV